MIALKTIVLLFLSNLFMTYAWYGHLKTKSAPIFLTILMAWGIAFFEYCLQVPANRIGHEVFSASQLKAIQEAISFSCFALFAIYYLKEKPTVYDYSGFALIFCGVLISVLQPK